MRIACLSLFLLVGCEDLLDDEGDGVGADADFEPFDTGRDTGRDDEGIVPRFGDESFDPRCDPTDPFPSDRDDCVTLDDQAFDATP